jgi:4,5-DOPA dioxygenase extradiol
MPVSFVGRGVPVNAIEERAFTKTLEALAPRLPRPKAVCVVSAHWVTPGSEVLAVAKPKSTHDFTAFRGSCMKRNTPRQARLRKRSGLRKNYI